MGEQFTTEEVTLIREAVRKLPLLEKDMEHIAETQKESKQENGIRFDKLESILSKFQFWLISIFATIIIGMLTLVLQKVI